MPDFKSKTPPSVRSLFKRRSGPLDKLLGTTARLRHLNNQVLKLLPRPLADHCQVAGIHDRTLIIYTDSAAWSTRLRLAIPGLVKSLKAKGISKVEARVQPASPIPPKRKIAPPELSAESADHLRAVARSIKDDKLRNALERLASRGQKENPET